MKKLLLIGSLVASLFAIEFGHYKCVYVGYIKNDVVYKNDKLDKIDIDVTQYSVSDGVDKYNWFASSKKGDFYKNSKGIIEISNKRVKGLIPVTFSLNDKNITLILACLTDKDLKKSSK